MDFTIPLRSCQGDLLRLCGAHSYRLLTLSPLFHAINLTLSSSHTFHTFPYLAPLLSQRDACGRGGAMLHLKLA